MAETRRLEFWGGITGMIAVLGVLIALMGGLRQDLRDTDKDLHAHESMGWHEPMNQRVKALEDRVRELEGLHPRARE